uniref:Small t antigen n=1 Tax=Bank vole polyomavirus TaxID=1737522 RepID=A0A0P0I2H1_9POLY|nr:small T antigen [Bank vole polyomavirus]
MDRTLSRSEAKELMQLLDLDMCCWGNLPLMRKAYLNKCKEHHPDKGGNEELMKRLNSLYLQLEESVKRMQCLNEEDSMWSTTQVHQTQYACGDYYGINFMNRLCNAWDACLPHGLKHCNCISCYLKRNHAKRWKELRVPMTWIMCYCIDCYLDWFGFPLTYETFQWWGRILQWSKLCEVGLPGNFSICFLGSYTWYTRMGRVVGKLQQSLGRRTN